MKRFLVVGSFVLVALILGCGNSDVRVANTSEPTRSSAEVETETTFGRGGEEWLRRAVAARGITGQEPRWSDLQRAAGRYASRLVLPYGDPPKEVLYRDLRIGKGPKLEAGDGFGAPYKSFYYRTGEATLLSVRSLAQYTYGVGEVVRAWEPGLEGMRVGGLRELIAPSNWVYHHGAVVYLVRLAKIKPR